MIKEKLISDVLKLGDEDLISMDIIKRGKNKNKYYNIVMKGSGVYSIYEYNGIGWVPKYKKNIMKIKI